MWLALLIAAAMGLAAPCAAFSQASITVELGKPGHPISPHLWGIFFEDINNSADGGIYPEMVRNRSFEDSKKLENWKFSAVSGDCGAEIDDSRPLNPFNRQSLRVRGNGAWQLENEGYWGMNIVKGETYRLRVAARQSDGSQDPITVELVAADGRELARGKLSAVTSAWRYHEVELQASDTDAKANLQLSGSGKGSLFLDMVSLLPRKTWKDHGMRVDLAESLDGLRPSFVRFPGGCWVEGEDFAHMNHWKNTIGDVDARTPLWNIWGYNATHGLGFHEYLQLAEDLGATPLFDINVGMSHREIVPLDRMDQWVQDALDAIEYANGPTNSVWGARRAAAGHPEPFHLKFMEIGNENGGQPYRERWPLFVKAIRERYPEVQLIANHWQGSYPKSPAPDLVDEHYYEAPEDFMRRATQYDRYERNGPKIFVGEYAVTRRAGQGNLRAALGEAAFMTGIERNSDIVAMACYAPLFVNMNHRAWNPDLINFDSSKWYGLPGYYVQQMFSANRGDVSLPVQLKAPENAPAESGKGKIGVGTWNTQAEFKDIRVTAPDGKVLFVSDFSSGTEGWRMLGGGDWKTVEGALRQTSDQTFVRAIVGETNWTDYTISLKAKKLGGAEGFLVLFHIESPEDRNWWNIGGWNNTQHAIEYDGTMGGKQGFIETGKWYDIRVEVRGNHVKCHLDGELVHDLDIASPKQVPTMYACASKEKASGDIIVKVVNAATTPIETTLNFSGESSAPKQGMAMVLTSASGMDENSLAEPTKVSPKSEPISCQGSTFKREFPANSFTVLRLKTSR